MHTTYHPWRPLAFVIGFAAAGVGCYGAYEYALKLEGEVTYLVLAAPLIAAMAALIPPMAEAFFREGAPLKAILWWVALIPCAAVVFFAAAERTHFAKAGQQADITARAATVGRAESELKDAREALRQAEAEEAKAKAQRQCGPLCREATIRADQARDRVAKAEQALVKAQGSAVAQATLVAPVWLLPAALDLIAFMAIWSGLSGPWWSRVQQEAPRPRVKPRKPAASKRKPKKQRTMRPANANTVVRFPA